MFRQVVARVRRLAPVEGAAVDDRGVAHWLTTAAPATAGAGGDAVMSDAGVTVPFGLIREATNPLRTDGPAAIAMPPTSCQLVTTNQSSCWLATMNTAAACAAEKAARAAT